MLRINDATFSWNQPGVLENEIEQPETFKSDSLQQRLIENKTADRQIENDFRDKDMLLQRISFQINPVSDI